MIFASCLPTRRWSPRSFAAVLCACCAIQTFSVSVVRAQDTDAELDRVKSTPSLKAVFPEIIVVRSKKESDKKAASVEYNPGDFNNLDFLRKIGNEGTSLGKQLVESITTINEQCGTNELPGGYEERFRLATALVAPVLAVVWDGLGNALNNSLKKALDGYVSEYSMHKETLFYRLPIPPTASEGAPPTASEGAAPTASEGAPPTASEGATQSSANTGDSANTNVENTGHSVSANVSVLGLLKPDITCLILRRANRIGGDTKLQVIIKVKYEEFSDYMQLVPLRIFYSDALAQSSNDKIGFVASISVDSVSMQAGRGEQRQLFDTIVFDEVLKRPATEEKPVLWRNPDYFKGSGDQAVKSPALPLPDFSRSANGSDVALGMTSWTVKIAEVGTPSQLLKIASEIFGAKKDDISGALQAATKKLVESALAENKATE